MLVVGGPRLFSFPRKSRLDESADAVAYSEATFLREYTALQYAVGIDEATAEVCTVSLHVVIDGEEFVAVVAIEEGNTIAVAPTPVLVVKRHAELPVGQSTIAFDVVAIANPVAAANVTDGSKEVNYLVDVNKLLQLLVSFGR